MRKLIIRLHPRHLKEKLDQLIIYSHLKIDPEIFITYTTIIGLISALVVALILRFVFKVPFLVLSFLGLFVVFYITPYLWLVLQIDKKSSFIENIFPDALQLMASNLRSGLTTDIALLLSARPEFGVLKDEINVVGKEITLGEDVGDALLHMTGRIKSRTIERTIELIVAGLRSGGELASLLEQTARDLRRQRLIDQKIRTNVHMYVIFIFIAVAFGAPILFGLSSFLVEVLKSRVSEISVPPEVLATSQIPLTITDIKITNTFIITYILAFLITSSVLGGLIIGLISKGRERAGLRLIPLLLIVTISLFFLVRFILIHAVGSLFI